MSTEAQIKANRLNARKSTGPKTAEGKAAVAQNAVKPCPERRRGNGLFAHENVIKCEKKADFDHFRAELLAGLAPAGGVESMLAERIVSLSWRLKRVERMSNEVIDVMIAKIETDPWHKELREEAGLLDSEAGRSELVLGWVTNRDFSDSQVLERLLMYERRIERSLYKAMKELQKMQRLREKEQAEATTHRGRDAHETQGRDALATEAATRSQHQAHQMKKQSQCVATLTVVKVSDEKGYENSTGRERQTDGPKQSQSVRAVDVQRNCRTG